MIVITDNLPKDLMVNEIIIYTQIKQSYKTLCIYGHCKEWAGKQWVQMPYATIEKEIGMLSMGQIKRGIKVLKEKQLIETNRGLSDDPMDSRGWITL